ncbi:MAG: AraC family transcriptional regulator [Silicimonas sp.]
MEDKVITAPLSDRRECLQTMRFAFNGLNRELRSDGMAARAVVEAYLRVILIEVYRAGQSQMAGGDKATSSNREFTKFIELVEAHFRERWTVNAYAGSLGMSRDRLGDICHRVRGLRPKDLIDRRVTVEARLQLENSSNSIQEIAALLGFSSSPQFTRFFVRTMGTPPGLYRKECANGVLPDEMEPVLPYEWP